MKFLSNLFVFLFLLNLAGCRSTPAFNFGVYSQAERFYEKKQYSKAIAKYEEYVRENPDGNLAAISYYYTAKSYEGLGEREKAREIYQKIAKEYPNVVWADFATARLKELGSSLDKAV